MESSINTKKKSEPLIETIHLKKYFPVKSLLGTNKRVIKSVDDVSFTIQKGETFGLVGESGCGKSTLGRSILRMHEITDGEILYKGTNIAPLSKKELVNYRNNMQIIFQDPYSSLNPSWNVEELLNEPLKSQTKLSKAERAEKIEILLDKVGMKKEDLSKFPYEFSGGQRQRIGIARALTVDPEFVLCDEPISALDVSIQAQVVNMLEDLQKELNLTYLFIAHDLSMVRHISNRIGVMYLGHIVEIGETEQLYTNPLHPYTKALLSAIPVADPIKAKNSQRVAITGELPSPLNVPKGCPFSTRCPYVKPICNEARPELKGNDMEHSVACFLYQ